MANTSIEQRALRFMRACEQEGRQVKSVKINGKEMEFFFVTDEDEDADPLAHIDFKDRRPLKRKKGS